MHKALRASALAEILYVYVCVYIYIDMHMGKIEGLFGNLLLLRYYVYVCVYTSNRYAYGKNQKALRAPALAEILYVYVCVYIYIDMHTCVQ